MNLPEKLAALRKAAGLSQDSAAEALGITRQAVSRWEQGVNVPSLDSLRALSRLYGVSLDELLCCGERPAEQKEQEEPPKAADTPHSGWTRERKIILALCVLLAAAAAVIAVIRQISEEKQEEETYIDEMEQGQVDIQDSENVPFTW